MSKNSYRKIYLKSKKYYSEIDSVPCSALNGKPVYFNKQGFQHLIRKGKRYRKPAEIIRRLRLLPFAVQAVQTAKKTYRYEILQRQQSTAHFWTLREKIHYQSRVTTLRIIIRKLNDGHIHFFSV